MWVSVCFSFSNLKVLSKINHFILAKNIWALGWGLRGYLPSGGWGWSHSYTLKKMLWLTLSKKNCYLEIYLIFWKFMLKLNYNMNSLCVHFSKTFNYKKNINHYKSTKKYYFVYTLEILNLNISWERNDFSYNIFN